MRVLVCGSRDYEDIDRVFTVLDNLHGDFGRISLIIQGGAMGADRLARNWADSQGVPWIEVKAQWKRLGKRAGPERNQEMRDMDPDLVIAFPLPISRGTWDMVERATLP